MEKVAVAGNDDSGTSNTSHTSGTSTAMPPAATDFHPPALDVNPMRSTSSGRSSSVIASPSGSGRRTGRGTYYGSETGSGVGGGGESKMPGDAPLVSSVSSVSSKEEGAEGAGGAEGDHLRRMKRRQEQHRNATFSGLVQREQLMQLLSTRAFHTDPQQVGVCTVVRICTRRKGCRKGCC